MRLLHRLVRFANDVKGDALYMMELVLSLEKLNFHKLRLLHDIACKHDDAEMADFIGRIFLSSMPSISSRPCFVAYHRVIGGAWRQKLPICAVRHMLTSWQLCLVHHSRLQQCKLTVRHLPLQRGSCWRTSRGQSRRWQSMCHSCGASARAWACSRCGLKHYVPQCAVLCVA